MILVRLVQVVIITDKKLFKLQTAFLALFLGLKPVSPLAYLQTFDSCICRTRDPQ